MRDRVNSLVLPTALGVCVALGAWLPDSPFHRLGAFAWVGLLAWGMRSVGRLAVGPVRPSAGVLGADLPGTEIAAGWALLSLLLQGLAVARLWTPAVVFPVLMATVLFAAGRTGSVSAAGLPIRRRFHRIRIPGSRAADIAGVLLSAVVLMTLAWGAGPVWDYDSETYHLPAAQSFIDSHGLTVSEFNPTLNSPALGPLWHGLCLMVGQPSACALQMGLAAVVLSRLIWDFTRRWIGQSAAFWAVPIFWSGAIVTMVAATPRVEPLYCLFLFAAVCLLAEAFWSPRVLTPGRAVWIGLFLGLAAGTKYQALYGWGVIGGWAAVRWVLTPRLRTGRHLAFGGLIILAALVVSGPWWGKNLVAFGNPVYPFLHGSHRPSPWWSTRHLAGTSFDTPPPDDGKSLGIRVVESFLSPENSGDPPWHLPHYAFLCLLLIPFVRLPARAWEILAVGLAMSAVALSLDQVQRHQFGGYPFLSIAAACVVVEVPRQYRFGGIVPWLVIVSLAIAAFIPPRLLLLPELGKYLLAFTDERPLRSRLLGTFPDAVEWLNAETPDGSRILFCWEARTWRLLREAIVDPGGRNWFTLMAHERDRPEQVGQFLREQGIQYVFVHQGTMKYHHRVSKILNAELERTFERQQKLLIGTALDPVFRRGNIIIFAVRSPTDPGTAVPGR